MGRVADQRMRKNPLSQDLIFLERRNLKKVVEMVTGRSITMQRLELVGKVVSRKSRLNTTCLIVRPREGKTQCYGVKGKRKQLVLSKDNVRLWIFRQYRGDLHWGVKPALATEMLWYGPPHIIEYDKTRQVSETSELY